MKPQDSQVIVELNRILKNELTAINQYFLHSRMFKNYGFNRLAENEYSQSIDEMKHADELVERIILLEGLPNMQDLGKLLIGEDPVEMLKCDLVLEEAAIPDLREAIGFCESVSDYVSREILERILESEEEHVDWLETQLDLVDRIGISSYLEQQMHA